MFPPLFKRRPRRVNFDNATPDRPNVSTTQGEQLTLRCCHGRRGGNGGDTRGNEKNIFSNFVRDRLCRAFLPRANLAEIPTLPDPELSSLRPVFL